MSLRPDDPPAPTKAFDLLTKEELKRIAMDLERAYWKEWARARGLSY